VRVVGSVEINRPADQVWAHVADYSNDTSWRAGVIHMHPSQPGPAQVGVTTHVTTHEVLRLLGLTFGTDASIDRVKAGRLLEWHARDRQKQLPGARLVEPTGPGGCRFTEVMEVRLLGLLRPLEPLWRGCSTGRPPPTSDGLNICWRRRRSSADQHRRRRRPEVGPLVSAHESVHTRPPSVAATLQSQVLFVSKASAGPSSAPPVLSEPCAARVRATLVRGRSRPPPASQDLTKCPLRACLSTTEDRWIQPLS
jgi:hypothetical protein